jgi:radical SAM superfamily enzyme YgiQ (UPF0313 family)
VTLIHPPFVQLRSALSHFKAIPPIGLAYVAAVLRDAGHEVEVIDGPGLDVDQYIDRESPVGTLSLQGLTLDQIVERISPTTQVIGITHMFLTEWPIVRELAAKAKAKVPEAKIVLGGENATAFWETIFRESPDVDFCVLGEGEFSMRELVNRLASGSDTTFFPGVVGRAGLTKEVREAPPKQLLPPRTRDLMTIPWPAWDLFPIEAYLDAPDGYGVHRGRAMTMIATRGCPFQCTFCSNPTMWGTTYRTRPPEDVVREIRHYMDRYRAVNINFVDLTAIVKREWILEFCGLLKSEGLKITWQLPVGTRSEALDEEVLRALYETGCRNIVYAPENGSSRLLKIMKKRVDLEAMMVSMRAAYRVGLSTSFNIIIGHPEETFGDLLRTAIFLIRGAWVGCRDTAVMIFTPYPGSEDARVLEGAGKLKFDESYYYQSLTRSGASRSSYSKILSAGQLVVLQFAFLLLFYAMAYALRPWRFLQILRGLLTGREESLLDKYLRAKFKRPGRTAVGDPAN